MPTKHAKPQDDRQRLRKLHYRNATGARAAAVAAQAETLEAPRPRERLFKEDRITIALFVFVASATLLPMALLIVAG